MIWRGLWERRWQSLLVLVVAVVPVAAAAYGPLRRDQAETAIVRDVLAAAPVEGRGWHYSTKTDPALKAVAGFARDFTDPPVTGMEIVSPRIGERRSYPVVWQDGQCAHVTILEGRCPAAPREVLAEEGSALEVGEPVRLALLLAAVPGTGEIGPAPLTVVGRYRANQADPFWFGRPLAGNSSRAGPLLTVRETRTATVVAGTQDSWSDYAIVSVNRARVRGSDLPGLSALHGVVTAAGRAAGSATLGRFADTLDVMNRQVGALGVPLALVVAQLAALGWLLLFQTVADLVRARGPEITLARLRGQSRLQVWRFCLAEPLAVLAVALAAGTALAWLAAARSGPVALSAAAVGAGAATVFGGLAAAVLAARGMAWRPVTEQWRRVPRRAARGWVLDTVVLVVAGVGLVELLAGGIITEPSGRDVAALAAPGLLALAAALLAARLLPPLARTAFAATRRGGGLAGFLAVRQVARGAATAGSVIVVAATVGVAVFAGLAWTVASANYREVARAHTGAASVIDVAPGDIARFRRAVEAADPSGRAAAPVVRVPGNPAMLAADPARLAHVAYGYPAPAGALSAPVVPRVWVQGDRLRVTAVHERPPDSWTARVFGVFATPGTVQPAQIPLGPLRPGTGGDYEWNLPGACRDAPCELRGFRSEVLMDGDAGLDRTALDYTITRLDVRRDGRWSEVEAALSTPGAWTGGGSATERGLVFPIDPVAAPLARPATFPERLPALVNGPVDGGMRLPGLDDAYAAGFEQKAAYAVLPGLDQVGALVDLDLADRVAYGEADQATFEVWVAAGEAGRIAAALERENLAVSGIRHAADLERRFTTQGPGAALTLLLTAAVAAAALALGRAVLALYTAARARGYELAALDAAGVKPGALRLALMLEQVLVLGAGTCAGLAAGVVAARLALPRIPQFADQPVTPPLAYPLDPVPVVVVGSAALLGSLLLAAVLSEVLLRGVTVERLRETAG
ncbi:hypothetical protein Aph01nite_70110 [Acrocarpospora phusangensis]|uniref:ABC3 transporter permease C-terminal domain-containing protein n=1 Tax=Acrocarpospora phusangensis TaxID=1070424 RepID=A0A919QIY6_9ACTN|nr:FtsX-like permease family protein [Acrocarpospora phusangensis]GIH28701.1 hypothetical protein Aph01nite_70110 [Acrocarpospora phusangensis]